MVYFSPEIMSKIERHGDERGCNSFNETVRDMCRYAMDSRRKKRKGAAMLKAESELRGRIRFYAMTHLADESQGLANDIFEHQGLVERPDHMADMPRPTIEQLDAGSKAVSIWSVL